MINRYAIAEITRIWSVKNKLHWWWKTEKLVCAAWHQLGVINFNDWQSISQQTINIDVARFLTYEVSTRHEVAAFLAMILEQFTTPAKRWIHYGLTSSDIIDTTQNLLIVQSIDVIRAKAEVLAKVLLRVAYKEKRTLMIGRTHGVFAEPISLGVKFLNWYAEVKRGLRLLNNARDSVAVVNLSGSVGNYAHLDPQIQTIVGKQLKLKPDWTTAQITQRDRYIPVFGTLAGLANTCAKIALEFRHWQKSEVNEVIEQFDQQQQTGSSSMPHKQNPVSAENICGLARVLVSNVQIFYSNNLLWNERDISHSSNERIIIPQCFHLATYIMNRLVVLVENMQVNARQIKINLAKTNHHFYSQLVMNYLICDHKWSRDQAYAFVKKCSYQSVIKQRNFLTILWPALVAVNIDTQPLIRCCTSDYYLKHTDLIFQNVLHTTT